MQPKSTMMVTGLGEDVRYAEMSEISGARPASALGDGRPGGASASPEGTAEPDA
jgi:hypothetical protein